MDRGRARILDVPCPRATKDFAFVPAIQSTRTRPVRWSRVREARGHRKVIRSLAATGAHDPRHRGRMLTESVSRQSRNPEAALPACLLRRRGDESSERTGMLRPMTRIARAFRLGQAAEAGGVGRCRRLPGRSRYARSIISPGTRSCRLDAPAEAHGTAPDRGAGAARGLAPVALEAPGGAGALGAAEVLEAVGSGAGG